MKVPTLASIGVMLWTSFAIAQTSAAPSPPASIRECFAQVSRLAKADNGDLWGHLFEGPLLLVDPQSKAIFANQQAADNSLAASDGIWLGTWPADRPLANTSVEWAGTRWAMVQLNSIPKAEQDRGILLMHESFHRLQPQLGLALASPINAHLESEDGRTWMRLEMLALARAIAAPDPDRAASARDALLFRSLRHKLTGPDAATEEAALEANEGLAEYTGLKLACANPDDIRTRIALALQAAQRSSSFTRSFAYATGPAYGVLLDQYQPGWRKTIPADPNLAPHLATALAFTPPADLLAAATARVSIYDGNSILTEEHTKAVKHQERIAELKATYIDGRTLRIVTSPKFNFAFNPNTAEAIDSAHVVHFPLTASDEWGTLEAPKGGMVDFSSPMSIALPIPAGTTLDTVGWKIKLNDGYAIETPAQGPWRIVKK